MAQLIDPIADLAVVRVEFVAGLEDRDGVVKTVLRQQQVHEMENGLRAVGTKGKGLLEGEVRLLGHSGALSRDMGILRAERQA